MKGLFLLVGECFREGHQHSRLRDTPASVQPQEEASQSHMRLVKKLEENGEVDIIVHTTDSIYKDRLIEIYSPNLKKFSTTHACNGLQNAINRAIREYFPSEKPPVKKQHMRTLLFKMVNIEDNYNTDSPLFDQYDYIYICRIDIFLKDAFINLFNPGWHNIRFPQIMPRGKEIPLVSDVMMFIPKKYFRILQNAYLSHEVLIQLRKIYRLSKNDVGMMIDTIHDSDSAKQFNPIYRMCSRPECKERV
jgi:hypothetical protein